MSKPSIFISFVVSGLLMASVAQADGSQGIAADDPMVRITAGHMAIDVPKVLKAVAQDVGEKSDLKPGLVTYYWQSFDAIVLDGKTSTDRPLFVDLYVPCFFTGEKTRQTLEILADAIAKETELDKKWIFIHAHVPQAGQVYISGQVMTECKAPASGKNH